MLRWLGRFLMWLGVTLVVVVIRALWQVHLMRYLVNRMVIFNQQVVTDWLSHFRDQIMIECCIAVLFAGFAAAAHTIWDAKRGCRAETNRLKPPP